MKIITDLKTQNSGTFIQSRLERARLTYHRMGRLLSAMGFTKARTSQGRSAIIWHDGLLSPDTSSDAHDPGLQGV